MIESLGMLAYELLLELLVASLLVWVVVVVVIRCFSITDPAWRVRFSALPVLLPVFGVPLIHLLIRPLFPEPHSAPLEHFLNSIISMSPLIAAVFLSVAGLLLFFGVTYIFQSLAGAVCYRLDWRHQHHQQSALWLRCNDMLQPVVSKLHMSPVRLVLTDRSTCGSIAFGPLGSYIVLSRALVLMLDDEELEGLLAHELGHIKRKDTLFGVVVGASRRLLAFSPFAQTACRSFSHAQEEATDDLAIRTSGRPLALASCLVKACRLTQGHYDREPSTCLLSSTSSAEHRIRRLFENYTCVAEPSGKYRWLFFGLVAVVFTILLLVV